jgi:hypothetical protein
MLSMMNAASSPKRPKLVQSQLFNSDRLFARSLAQVLAVFLVGAQAIGQTNPPTAAPTKDQATPSPVSDEANWAISPGHSILWRGSRSVLAGIRVDGAPEAIKDAAKLGFKDFCVELSVVSGSGTANWEPVLAALEGVGAEYLISVNNLAPMADAYAVDPAGYRVPGITSPRHISIKIPGATSVLAVLATSSDGTIQWNKKIATPDGQLDLDVDPDNELDHILLIYPRLTNSSLIDCWEGFDQARDNLLSSLQRHKPGTGCRGIVNPIGASPHLFGGEISTVPTSAVFQLQYRNYLENRYHSVDTAINSWSMSSSSVDSFDRLARLVPLWSGLRGIPGLWDPVTNEVIPVDSKHSVAWDDLRNAILSSARLRFRHLTDSIHQVVDVPVVQEWNGWSLPYEGATGVDGIGLVTDGAAPSTLLEEAGRGASSMLRWSKPGWLIASRIQGLDTSTTAEMQAVAEDLTNIGARGYFLQSTNVDALKKWAGVAQALRGNPTPDEVVRPLYFPENAYNPAEPQSLPGGTFWLPSPDSGDRLDLGSKIRGYSIGNFNDQRAVIWSPAGPINARLRLLEPKRAVVTTVSGTPVPIKSSKTWIEVPLSAVPVVISGINELPVPEIAIDETATRVEQLIAIAEATHRDITADAFAFRDGQNSLDRGPGAGYLSMRHAYSNLSLRLADYTWIEGESAKTFTLGEVVELPGCSAGRGFSVRSRLSLPGQTYRVEFPARTHSTNEQEVWIAAKIAPGDRGKVHVVIGSQSLPITGTASSPYSDGFAWYRCGVTRLGAESGSIAVELDGSSGVDVIIDTVLLTPRAFTPSGTTKPDAIAFTDEPAKKSRKKRG